MKETSSYYKFENEVKKYTRISTDELWLLIRRFSKGTGRKINAWGSKSQSYDLRHAQARGNYYRFWLIRLEKKGIIKASGPMWWVVNSSN